MSIRYVMERRSPTADWIPTGTAKRALMLTRLARFVLFQRVRNRRRGNDYPETWKAGIRALRQIRRRTAFEDEGYKIFVQRKRDRNQLSIHKVEVADPAPHFPGLGPCHPEIQKAYDALAGEYGIRGIRNGGTWFCRFIDGTHTVSRHGYRSNAWKGAAGDVFANPDSMDALIRRAQFLVKEARAKRLHLDAVIVGNQVWTRRDDQWHPYHGAFHRHIHLEVHQGSGCM